MTQDSESVDPRLADLHARATAGEMNAQLALAQIHCGGAAIGQGDLPGKEFGDAEQAYRWFQASAEQGSVEGQVAAGTMLTKGEGTAQNDGEAMRWFFTAADAGSGEAMRRIGLAYANGRGVEADETEAVAWWTRAAAADDVHAAFNLGVSHLEGRLGLPENPAAAEQFLQQAADLGHPQAAELLDSLPS